MENIRIKLLRIKKEAFILFPIFFIIAVIKVIYFPIYEASTVIMVDVKKSPTSIEAEKIDLRESVGYIRTHAELMKSNSVLRSVVDELRLFEDTFYWKKMKEKNTSIPEASKEGIIRMSVDLLRQKYITIESPPFTNLIEIKVKYKDPVKAAEIANVLVKNYINWNIEFVKQEVDGIIKYLNREVLIARDRLQNSENELKKFREENNIISLSDEVKAHLEIIPEEIKTHYQVIQAMEIKLFELEVELSRIRELYTADSPQVKYMQERISNLKNEINNEIARSKSTEDYASKLKDIPEKEIMLSRFIREVKINEALYTFLVQEQEKAHLLEVKETTENIKIVSTAFAPLKPKGRITNLIKGFLISLILSVSLPLIFEYGNELLRYK